VIRRRDKPDGLPYRVYERHGVRVYSIGHKSETGAWTFRLQCPADDALGIANLRREAIRKASDLGTAPPADGSFAALTTAWLAWQTLLPAGSSGKRADSTLAENRREIAALNRSFGPMPVVDLERGDAYEYLDACLTARDSAGNSRPRPEKGNKEIALARTVLEWGVRKRWLQANPFDGTVKLVTDKSQRLVSPQELALALEVGRRMGGPQHIVALALRTAWLCLRRSVEVRALTRDQIGEDGITWKPAKRQRGQAQTTVLIEWSPDLRATIDEALAIHRNKLAGSWYVFGNLSGQRYTKGGWKATLSKLMTECMTEAGRRKIAFAPFSLQDCRPMGVTGKLARGDLDTQDATAHTSERMLRQVYDRRRVRVAKPAG
jgi:integrase